MRVCIVTHRFVLTDGQGRINLETARYLASAGHEVVLISTQVDPALAAMPNVTWQEVAIPKGLPSALLKYQAFAFAARRALLSDRRGFDIIQLNGCITYHPSDVNVACFVHSNWLKSAYHPARARGGLYGLYQRGFTAFNAAWEKRAFRQARRVVALAEGGRRSLIADVGLPPDKISVLSPGVDTAEFRPLAPGEPNLLRAETGVPENAFLAFFVGDIKSNRKNLDLVLRAMTNLPPEIHLAVAGSSEGSPYPGMARAMGLAERTHFLGYRKDVPTLLRGANAFAFPSHYDTFGLVIAEAMASGIPVITAPSVDASDQLRDGESGLALRDSADLEGMTAALRRLAAEPEFARRLGKAARAAAETLTWERMARRYETLYEEVVAEKQRQGKTIEAKT